MQKVGRIGLLAGAGELPALFAEEARKRGATVVAFAAKGIASPALDSHVDKIYWLDLAKTGKLQVLFLTNRIRNLVMIGKIPKDIFFKKDFSESKEIQSLLTDTENRSDDSILREVSKKAERLGFTFLDPKPYLSDIMPQKGTLTKREPTVEEWADIAYGKEIALSLGKLDIGQTVAVKNKAVLAVEAIEGTDETIRRAGRYAGGGVVVVKVLKPNQDTRFDIPTVGLKTVELLIEAGTSVLAFEAGKTIFVNREESVTKADDHGICIVAIE